MMQSPCVDPGARDSLEQQLDALLPDAHVEPKPLHRAMRHAVLAGGKRLRPRLLLAVFNSCQAGASEAEVDLALRAACAIELIHAGSLVIDDLPSFDGAATRRDRPTVHMLLGEPMAILTGHALLSRAFEVMAEASPDLTTRSLRMVGLFGRLTGSREGIIGGQSMETSPQSMNAHGGELSGSCRASDFSPETLYRYHAMKTGALFRLAAEAGAIAAGRQDTSGWMQVGQRVGLAYQLADDLYDASCQAVGKPVNRDVTLGRPNSVLMEGDTAVRARLLTLLDRSRDLALSLAADPSPMTDFFHLFHAHFARLMGYPSAGV